MSHICVWAVFTSYYIYCGLPWLGQSRTHFLYIDSLIIPQHISFQDFILIFIFCTSVSTQLVNNSPYPKKNTMKLSCKRITLWFSIWPLELPIWKPVDVFRNIPLEKCLLCLLPLFQSYNVLFAPCPATFKGRGIGQVGNFLVFLWTALMFFLQLFPFQFTKNM